MRKRVVDRLRFQATVLAHVRDAVVATDGQQRITYWNRGAQRLYGVPVAEALGADLEEIYTCRWLDPEDEQLCRSALASQGWWCGESVHVKRDGTEIHVQSTISVLTDQHGGGCGRLALTRDIGGRKEMEERLARSEKLAALGRLAGGVAHELRSPIAAIANATFLLRAGLTSPRSEVREALNILDHELGNCRRILTSLLDYTRARQPDLRRADPNRLLREALAHLEQPPNIEVETHLADQMPTILADGAQLEQVVQNIVWNAVRAMPDGGTLTIRTRVASPDSICISFTDSGCGIPQKALSKLFEPLYTTRRDGVGMGLAVTKALVDAHGGRIDVESRVGEGSTFTVTLPIGHQGGL
ncbi:MAG: two-component system sensor histidine kinase NtrB [bacterium]